MPVYSTEYIALVRIVVLIMKFLKNLLVAIAWPVLRLTRKYYDLFINTLFTMFFFFFRKPTPLPPVFNPNLLCLFSRRPSSGKTPPCSKRMASDKVFSGTSCFCFLLIRRAVECLLLSLLLVRATLL